MLYLKVRLIQESGLINSPERATAKRSFLEFKSREPINIEINFSSST